MTLAAVVAAIAEGSSSPCGLVDGNCSTYPNRPLLGLAAHNPHGGNCGVVAVSSSSRVGYGVQQDGSGYYSSGFVAAVVRIGGCTSEFGWCCNPVAVGLSNT